MKFRFQGLGVSGVRVLRFQDCAQGCRITGSVNGLEFKSKGLQVLGFEARGWMGLSYKALSDI